MIVLTIYKYKIYCITSGQYEFLWDTVEPTTCPVNVAHTVNANSISVEDSDDAIKITNVDSPYSLTQRSLLCDTTTANITVNLPKAARCDGVQFVIKKTATANTVTITPNGSDTIDSLTTKSLTTLNQTVLITCNTTTANWVSTSYYDDTFLQTGEVPVSAITKQKGDIIGDNGAELVSLTAGSNTNALVVDSTQPLGIKWAQVDHVNLANIGTNTHAQIDTHLAASTGVHGVTGSLVGTSGAQTLSVKSLDTTCLFTDPATATKTLGFNLSGATTATKTTFNVSQTVARTITFPDTSDTLVGQATADTLTNKTLTDPRINRIFNGTTTLTFPSASDALVGQTTAIVLSNKSLNNTNVFHVDGTDNTKKLGFDTSTATTGFTMYLKSAHTANQTLTLPNATDTVALVGLSQTLSNKTLTDPTISRIFNTNTLTLPITSDTLVGRATIDIFTNKSFATTSCFFVDPATNTKTLGFDTSTAGTFTMTLKSSHTVARTLTLPDITDTLTSANVTQTLTNKKLSDSTTFIIDNIDATKQLTFNLAGASATTTLTLATNQTASNTLTFPNITDTLVTLSTTDTLLNKTIQGATNIVDANNLKTTGASVNVSSAAPPSTGQTLKATSATTATWQNVGTTTWRNIWNSGTAYAVNDVVTSGGSCWICILASTNNIPPNPTFWNLVVDGFHWKDTWSSLTAYIINDVVVSGTASYICILANTNNIPPNITYWDVFLSTTAPGGSTTQVQYNSAGSFAGTPNLVIDSDNYPVIGDSSGSAYPTMALNGVKLFSTFRIGRRMLGQIDSMGYGFEFQPHIGLDKIGLYSPAGNSTTVTQIGIAITAVGTATARNIAATRFATSIRRIGYLGTATAGNSASIRGAQTFWRGNATGLGGFYFIARFVLSSTATVNTQASFVGLAGTAAVLTAVNTTTNPSAITAPGYLGFGVDSGDTTWSFMHNTAAAAVTKNALTGTFPPRNLSAEVFEARIYCPSNSSIVYYSLEVLNGGSYFEGSTSTNIPANTTFLCPHMWTSNTTTAAIVGIDIASLYISSNY